MTLKLLPERLVIVFPENEIAETSLRIANVSDKCCAFKIKTTTPDRYLVKPNHGLLRKDATIKISIVVVQTKKREILAKAKLDGTMRCTDKFLVQSLFVDQPETGVLEKKTSSEQTDAITQLFANRDRRVLCAKKVLVDFTFDKLPAEPDPDSKNSCRETGKLGPVPGTPEAMFVEIVALRKKYDDLVAFTVKLTAERDSLSNSLHMATKPDTEASADSVVGSAGESKYVDYRVLRSYRIPLVLLLAFLIGYTLP